MKNGNYSAQDIADLTATGSRNTGEFTWKEIAKYQYQDLGFFGTNFPNNSHYFNNPEYKVESETVDSKTPVSKKITNPGTKIWDNNGKVYGFGDTFVFDKDIIETVYQKNM